jgi:hypothetical protein
VVPYAARVNLRYEVKTTTEVSDLTVTASCKSQMPQLDPFRLVANKLVIIFHPRWCAQAHDYLRLIRL